MYVYVYDKAFIEKYNEVMKVVQGQAGLRSLQRHTAPMNPTPHPYLMSRREHLPEPLYRRAKLAQSIRESSKVRPPRSAPGGVSRSMILYDEPGKRLQQGDVSFPRLSPGKQNPRMVQQQQQQRQQRSLQYGQADAPQLIFSTSAHAIDDLSLGSIDQLPPATRAAL